MTRDIPLADPDHRFGLWAVARHRDTRRGLLEAAVWGLLTGPLVGFVFSGGLGDPIGHLREWRDNLSFYAWAMPLIGLVWAVCITFFMILLRYWAIPRLARRGGPAIQFLKLTAAGFLAGGFSMLAIQAVLLYLFSLRTVPGGSMATVVGIGGILGIVFANMFFVFHEDGVRLSEARRRERELERRRLESELMNVTMRIRPHFFFNTLNTLSALIDRDRDVAQEYLADLADLFRKSFALGMGGHLCPWREERALLENYIRLEQNRYGDRLSTAIEIEAPEDAPFPAFLLQPLVENAVHHGVSKIKTGGAVRLSGRFDETARRWSLRVENPAPANAKAEVRPGHALEATQRRVALMDGSLSLAASGGRFTVDLEFNA